MERLSGATRIVLTYNLFLFEFFFFFSLALQQRPSCKQEQTSRNRGAEEFRVGVRESTRERK